MLSQYTLIKLSRQNQVGLDMKRFQTRHSLTQFLSGRDDSSFSGKVVFVESLTWADLGRATWSVLDTTRWVVRFRSRTLRSYVCSLWSRVPCAGPILSATSLLSASTTILLAELLSAASLRAELPATILLLTVIVSIEMRADLV